MCPEAPVPVFNPIRTTTNPGMAGNVVENIKAIRPEAEIVFWHQIEEITKKRIVDEKSNQMIVRIDDGEIKPVQEFGFLSPERRSVIQESDVVIVSDYQKGYLSDETLIQIGQHARFSVLDTKRKLTQEIVNSFSFIKLNEHEAENNKEFEKAENIIVTLGAKGALTYGELLHVQQWPVETIDVSGAGDTFTATFAVNYFETQNLSSSIWHANAMSARVVSKRGVATP
jgi:bifunctional ADP-heptose synthase (sugar kinase/adenylyltransferase)